MLFATGATAGWIGDAVLGAGEMLGHRAVRETADGAYDTVKGTIKRRGSTSGDLPADRGETGRIAASGRKGIRLEDVQSRHDFVPGERVLFFDDFRDASFGAFPRRWTLKGPDNFSMKAPLEIAGYGGGKWVRYRPSNEREDALSSLYIRMDAGKDLPERFTVEFDAVLPPYDGRNQHPEYRLLLINHGSVYRSSDYEGTPSNVVRIGSAGASAGRTSIPFERGDGQPHRVSVRVEGRSVAAYLDGELVVSDPEGIVRPVTVVGMELAFQTGADILPLMFTNFRLAAVEPVTVPSPSSTSRSGPARASLP